MDKTSPIRPTDDSARALARELQCVRAADAAPRARHDDDASVTDSHVACCLSRFA